MRKIYYYLPLLIVQILFYNGVFAQIDSTNQAQVLTKKTNLEYELKYENESLVFLSNLQENFIFPIELNGEKHDIIFNAGRGILKYQTDQKGGLVYLKDGSQKQIYHLSTNAKGKSRIKNIPLWLSILPPLIAIALALLFKEVIISLFIGIWTGAFIIGGLRLDSIKYVFLSLFAVIDKFILQALADTSHLSIILFSLLIGGMVAVISRNGGMAGVVNKASKYANTPRSSQFVTWLLGVAIFFDDYANTLIVGNTMRSLTDKYRISREKLAYIVDSTAAPVAAVAFITTWIGAELSYIDDAVVGLAGIGSEWTAYSIFLASLKYSFYPIFTLVFILIIIYLNKDFGKMYEAEYRARTTGRVSSVVLKSDDEPNMEDLSPVKGAPMKWHHAVIPVFVVILMTIYGLLETGLSASYESLIGKGLELNDDSWAVVWQALGDKYDIGFFRKLGLVIGSADSYVALLWASLSGVAVAIGITVLNKIMSFFDAMHVMTTGFKTMMPAIIILTMAWSLAITTEQLHTAAYLTDLLDGNINPFFMPSIIFVLAGFIAFSTGSSWSTMAILYPIAIPTTWAISHSAGLSPEVSMELLLNVIATVLGASVVGDHCSPISDTTILSSLASDCNHMDHVKTQMPYAMTVAAVSLVCGFFSTYFGGGIFFSILFLVLGIGVLFGIVWKFGKTVPG